MVLVARQATVWLIQLSTSPTTSNAMPNPPYMTPSPHRVSFTATLRQHVDQTSQCRCCKQLQTGNHGDQQNDYEKRDFCPGPRNATRTGAPNEAHVPSATLSPPGESTSVIQHMIDLNGNEYGYE